MRLIALCATLFITVSGYGQRSITDSLHRVDSVVVVGKIANKRNIGSRVTHIDKIALVSAQTKSLSELLLENSAIQIKSFGQGALTTASFRGMSSSHTQVLWNGISLNSSTLGNFDLSEIPIFFTDNVSLMHGSSAQQGGSGALGGSINFSTTSLAQNYPSVKLMSEYGSNNTFTEGFSFRTTQKRLTLSTRLFYQQSDNDYRYLNKVYSKDAFYERRQEADYNMSGGMQEVYYTTKSGDVVSAVVWLQHGERSLPQPIVSNKHPDENTKTTNVRSLIKYEGQRGKHNFKATAAYLTGNFRYSRAFSSGLGNSYTKNRDHAVIAKGEYFASLGNAVDLGADMSYRFDKVVSNNFERGEVDRNTLSARMFATIRASKRLHFEGQLMAEAVNGEVAPTYTLAARYHVIEELLSLKATHSYNYRFPSLNDLYWYPVGNLDLKSERGFSWDGTVSFTPRVGNVEFALDATYFLMNVDNWIAWVPTDSSSVWKPVNFSSVRSQGAEFSGKMNFKAGQTSHRISVNYTYAHSVDNSDRADGTHGRQLPYMPRNRWNGTYYFKWQNLWALYNVSFTDVRFTSADESYSTNAYTIHNAEIGGEYRFGKSERRSISLTLRVDNMFNSYYESTQYYPMPLRMFSLRAILSF